MLIRRTVALLSIACLMLSTGASIEAAPRRAVRRANAGGGVPITGVVVRSHGKTPVAGAVVRLLSRRTHHHHRHAATRKTTKPTSTATTQKAHKAGRRGAVVHTHVRHAAVASRSTTTGPNGQFSITAPRGSAMMLVASKKHVGTGHATVATTAGQTAAVTIKLHKHHHSHAKK